MRISDWSSDVCFPLFFGGGVAVIRLADGRELVLDGLATAPALARPDSFTPVSDRWPDYMETEGPAHPVGAKAVTVPGHLRSWREKIGNASRRERVTQSGLLTVVRVP